MVSVVNDSCIKCKSCVDVCPVDAFHEGDSQVVVDPDVCIDCGVCISECPQGAICNDADAEQKWIYIGGAASIVLTLCAGLWLVRDN